MVVLKRSRYREILSTSNENIAYKICEDFNFDILLTGHHIWILVDNILMELI